MIRRRATLALAASSLAGAGLAACHDQAAGGAGGRDHITVVGSSTVFPFTTLVAEQWLDRTPGMHAPAIESTGTGAGMRLFCAGIGTAHPDIEDASRRMRAREYAACAANGAGKLLEVQVGLDGIAFAQGRTGPALRLTPADLYRALAAAPFGRANTARTWAAVNPALPAMPIEVYGPPATSGTRDVLAELILAKGCETLMPAMAAKKTADPAAYARTCTAIREDGAYVDAGENDNLIVQKLRANPAALGIFGYSYLEQNRDTLAGVPIGGVAPTYAAIASGAYPGSRPLFVYVKIAHLNAVPGLRAFLARYVASWGPGGPLVAAGLIAAPDPVRASNARVVAAETPLDPAALR